MVRFTPLSTDRLGYELNGMKAFAKYTAFALPKFYLYDETENYLFTVHIQLEHCTPRY